MTKTKKAKKAKRTARKKEPVRFDFSGGELRKVTITANGFEPFEITFRVPTGPALHDLYSRAHELQASGGSMGERFVTFVEKHLESWSLEHEPNQKALEALFKANEGVFFSIFNTIDEAGNKVKN